MAKVTFSKLKCKINEEISQINFNNETIEVQQYLPMEEKLALISRVVSESYDEEKKYFNPMKTKILFELELLFTYTNISFTDKQKENYIKLYDLVASSGLLQNVLTAINQDEYALLHTAVIESIQSVHQYNNSLIGIIDTIKNHSINTIDIENLQGSLDEVAKSPLVQEILPLMQSMV